MKITLIAKLFASSSPPSFGFRFLNFIQPLLGQRIVVGFSTNSALQEDKEQLKMLSQNGNVGGQQPKYAGMHSNFEKVRYACDMLDRLPDRKLPNKKAGQLSFVVAALRECRSFYLGEQIHGYIVASDLHWSVIVGNSLINMYAKCGKLEDAYKVFDKMLLRDLVSWNTIIGGYVHNGDHSEALQLFNNMYELAEKADNVSFSSILGACALEEGKRIHTLIVKTGFESDVFVGNALITMYARCWSLDDGSAVFEGMPQTDVVSWNAMIAGYVQQGWAMRGLELFKKIKYLDTKPDCITFVSVQNACASLQDLEYGKQNHTNIIKSGADMDISVCNTLISMYNKCGSLEDAVTVFHYMTERNVVSWTLMINVYAQDGKWELANLFFEQMRGSGIEPNQATYVCLLSAYSSPEVVQGGTQVHGLVMKTGYALDKTVGNALVTMYSNCGSIENARQFFDRMCNREVESWNAMIAGYARYGQCEGSLHMFSLMQKASVKPNAFTFGSVVSACATLVTLEEGKWMHAYILKTGFESDVCVGSAVVDMYAKCGSIDGASAVFNNMAERNLVSWTAMIGGYAQHGYAEEALNFFRQMQTMGMKPDHVTFVGVLSACSRAGLVDEGRHYFNTMKKHYGVAPRVEHFACMVDLLGRAGLLDEAEDFIKKMPFQPSISVWQSLLGACRIHGNTELGNYAAECLLKLEPNDSATYLLLSNIYAADNRWDDVARVRKVMKNQGVKRESGRSWIHLNNIVYEFVVNDS